MFRLNQIALLLFFVIHVLAYKLCRERLPVRRRIIRKLCLLLLGGNLFRYMIVFPIFERVIQIPAEFSTVAYFVVPAIFLSRKRNLDCWAAYSALMAGFFYYAAMILAGQTIYGASEPLDVCLSLLCHGSLYWIGLVCASIESYPRKSWWGLLFGIFYVSLRALVLRPLVLGRSRMLIYILLDAIPARFVFPETQWSRILPVYYTLILIFLLVSIAVFYARSERQYRRFYGLCAAC